MPFRRVPLALVCAFPLSLLIASLTGCGLDLRGGVVTSNPTQQISVSVAGSATTRLSGQTQFNATVSGSSNTAVTWQVNGVTGGGSSSGTISTTGLYTAPSTLPTSPYTETISAVSQAAPTVSGSETENIENPLPLALSGVATEVGTSSTYTVVVTGSGFVPTSTISANGTTEATTYVSPTQLQATVAAGTAMILNITVANPNPGAAVSSQLGIALPIAVSFAEAGRIIDQTSFGPTTASIQNVAQIGLNSYLQQQFAATPTLMPQIPTNPLPNLCVNNNTAYPCAQSYFWNNAINGPDQLRQRVAFALSEMFVVSTQAIPGQAIPSYYNNLVNDSFGNFYTIMNDVSLSPAMGDYLNMLNSAKAPAGEIPNENYPRELMQLFTLGLDLLNQDGSQQLDGSGNPIPPYTETQVQAFARAYTGWTFATASGGSPTKYPNGTANYADPMAAVESEHDTTSKILLNGTVLPAGQTAEQDLAGALTNIFNHPNVAPFVCRQLIQHLVTSTPSAAYISRVTAVFNNNGSGTRGDMKAVITAILADPEARAGDTNASYDGGHLREPVLFITGFYRGLGFQNLDTVNNSYASLSSSDSTTLSEDPYRANSVFNFFPPNYVIPGTTLNAPEFGIENTATTTLEMTIANNAVNNKLNGYSVDLSNTSALGTLAANPAALVNQLSFLFMHSQMPAAMQTTIINAITPLSSNAQRARIAVYLVLTSSDYKIIH